MDVLNHWGKFMKSNLKRSKSLFLRYTDEKVVNELMMSLQD